MAILTVVAFVLALGAFFDAKRQGERLATIYESVDTKYEGVFPAHLDLLIRHVKQAKSFVCIVWDAVDIGSYVDPEKHNPLVDALVAAGERLRDSGQVRFLIWGEPQAISQAGAGSFKTRKARAFCYNVRCNARGSQFYNQLKDEGLLDKYNQEFADTPRLTVEDFAPFRKPIVYDKESEGEEGRRVFTIYQLCYHDYVASLLADSGVEIRVLRDIGATPLPQSALASQRGCGPDETRKPWLPPANLFWLADDEHDRTQGGFLFLAPGHDAPAFRTADRQLTDHLHDLFSANYHDHAKPYVHLIRRASETDVGDIEELANALGRTTSATTNGFLVPYTAREYAQFVAQADFFYVLLIGSRLCGFVLAHSSEKTPLFDGEVYEYIARSHAGPHLIVRQIGIAPGFEKQGLGSQLYDRLLAEAFRDRERFSEALGFIWKRPANPQSEAFHRARGWREVETYRLQDGKGVVGIWQYRPPTHS